MVIAFGGLNWPGRDVVAEPRHARRKSRSISDMIQAQTKFRRCSLASLAWSLIAFVSHGVAMSMAADIAMAIARRERVDDQAQRLSSIGVFDLFAWSAGLIALLLALYAARGETPRMRVLVLAAAVVANVWNLVAA